MAVDKFGIPLNMSNGGGGRMFNPANGNRSIFQPATPIDQGYYNSPQYSAFQTQINDPMSAYGFAFHNSPYFGQFDSTQGAVMDTSYRNYLSSSAAQQQQAPQQPVQPTMFNPGMNGILQPGMPQDSGFQGYNPSPINATGSYNTGDYASLLGGLFTGGIAGAAAGAGVNDAVARLQALGSSGVNDYTNLAKTVTQDINFKPYALTNSLGSTRQTAPGVIDQRLTDQQQSNVNMASGAQGGLYNFSGIPNTSGMANQAFGNVNQYLNPQGNQQIQNLSGMFGNIANQAGGAYNAATGLEGTTQQALRGAATGLNQIGSGFNNISNFGNQALQQGTQGLTGVGQGMGDLNALRAGYGSAAQGMTGILGGSTNDMASQLFNQQQAMRDPVQQRQQMELENRLRSQGRLGVSTSAYGGTPEQLAMAKAVQEQQSADAFNSINQGEALAAAQQNRALGLGQATSSMAQNVSALTDAQQNRATNLGQVGIGAQQAVSGLTNDQQNRALGLLSAGQQGTTLQDQLLNSQLGRATNSAQSSAALAAANQALKQGDVQTAASLFNLGSSAAQLPSQMQGQQIAQAGQLQGQALAPGAAQLQQLAASGTLGSQEANVAATRGRMFGDLAGAGLQERLTAESAGAALRGKQYTAALGALANKGAISGGDANTVKGMIDAGVTRVGNDLVKAGGEVIKGAYGALSAGVKSAWDSITSDSNGFSGVPGIDFGGGGGIDGGGWGSLAETTGEATNIIEDAWSAVSKWWDSW